MDWAALFERAATDDVDRETVERELAELRDERA